MVRFVIIGVVIAVAFTLYALVDAAMTDGLRSRGVPKPVWILLVVLLPVVGGLLWFFIGKGAASVVRPAAPDDDPRFTGARMSKHELELHMSDLEARLQELDNEIFPGEHEASEVGDAALPHTDDAAPDESRGDVTRPAGPGDDAAASAAQDPARPSPKPEADAADDAADDADPEDAGESGGLPEANPKGGPAGAGSGDSGRSPGDGDSARS